MDILLRVRFSLVIIASLMIIAPQLYADYQSDRKFDVAPDGGDILLLYPGKHSPRSYDMGVDEFIRLNGKPNVRRQISTREELLIYYSGRMLYRGTGAKNAPDDRERREFTVRDGRVQREVEIVQMVELGYAWMPRRNKNPHGEIYGEKNTINYSDVTPLGPVPELPAPTPRPINYDCPPGTDKLSTDLHGTADIDTSKFAETVIDETARIMGPKGPTFDLGEEIGPFMKGFYMGQQISPDEALEEDSKRIACKMSISLSFTSRGNSKSYMNVALCDRRTELSRKEVCDARSRLTQAVLSMGIFRAPNSDICSAYYQPKQRVLESSVVYEAFPVLLIGHGWANIETAFFTYPDSHYTVAIQHDNQAQCELTSGLLLCPEKERTLKEITELGDQLAQRFLMHAQ